MFRHPGTTANALYLDMHVERNQPFAMTGKHIYRNIWIRPGGDHATPY